MSIISTEKALEVITNPYDLSIYIFEMNSQCGFMIQRGSEGSFKLLVNSQPVFATSAGAIRQVKKILEKFCQIATEIFEDENDPLYYTFNPENKLVKDMDILTDEMIGEIISKLENFSEVDTSKVLAPTPP